MMDVFSAKDVSLTWRSVEKLSDIRLFTLSVSTLLLFQIIAQTFKKKPPGINKIELSFRFLSQLTAGLSNSSCSGGHMQLSLTSGGHKNINKFWIFFQYILSKNTYWKYLQLMNLRNMWKACLLRHYSTFNMSQISPFRLWIYRGTRTLQGKNNALQILGKAKNNNVFKRSSGVCCRSDIDKTIPPVGLDFMPH